MDLKTLLRNISMIVGIAAVAFAGLFFILYVDLYLKGDSIELFIGIILPLASVVFLILAESFKHKPIVFYVFKGVACAMAIGFVIYVIGFMSSDTYINGKPVLKLFKTLDGKTVLFSNDDAAMEIKGNKLPPFVIMIVCGIIGAIGQVANLVLNKLVGLD